MGKISRLRFVAATMAGAVLALMGVGNAFADSVSADGDTLSVGAGVSVSGNCAQPVSKQGTLTFTRDSTDSPKKFDKNGGALWVTFATGNSQVTASTSGAVAVPSDYTGAGDTFSVPFTTTVTDGSTAASHIGSTTVTVTAAQGTYSKSTSYAVTWNCLQNSAPTVSVTGVTDGENHEYGNLPTVGCSWTDDNDGSGTTTPTLTGPTGPRASAGLGTVQVSCAKTDSGGLTGTATASYAIVDTTAPLIPDLADVTAAAKDTSGASVSYTVPDATDAVDGNVPLSCAPAAGSQFALGKTAVTCTATDIAGNHSSKSFNVSVTDQDAPVVTVPDNMTVDATSSAGASVDFAKDVSATDNVDGGVTPACAPASGSTFGFGSTTVTCSATDKVGNKGSSAFTVTVQDKTAPVLATPSLDPVEATGPDGAKVTWASVTANDDTDSDVSGSVSCDHTSGAVFPLGDTTVKCTAKDSHDNVGESSFVVTVQDTTPPAVTVPKDIIAEADSSTGAVVRFVDRVSATDLVDGAATVSCTPASGSQFALDATAPVTCTSTDSHDNTGTASFNVKVVDTTPPAMPTLTDTTAEATGVNGATVDYSVGVATDTVDGQLSITCDPASGSTFALGKTTVECTATDAHGNTAKDPFTVTVKDTTPPTLQPVTLETAEATGPDGAKVAFSVTATDTVDPSPTITCDHQAGDTFPLGSTAVKCTATDFSGNSGDYTFTVNVADTTGPAVATVSSPTLEATGPDGAVYDYTPPTATDAVDGERPVDCVPPPGSTFPLGDTTGTCTAYDTRNNKGSSQFTVTVQDTKAPAMPDLPDVTAVATSKSGAAVSFDVQKAQDLVDGAVALVCDHDSGSTFPMGTTTVTCTATDAHHNTAIKSFTVTVGLSWSGFLAPVVNGGTYKQGSTIPVKFQLTGASAGITDLDARIWVRATNAPAGTKDTVATSTAAASDGNTFRWSSSDKQYMFNLSTKPLQVSTYDIIVDLGDGLTHTVRITLR